MSKQPAFIQGLTDEQILKEFVRRFECDGAVLVYLDGSTEFGFGRWRNTIGRNWVHTMFGNLKQAVIGTSPKPGRKAHIRALNHPKELLLVQRDTR
ncbi:hypothetical protein [Hymenobacter psoromatis]|uniref:hypothetical protein n=1 Tax=Hymenobacter psoromatis TaxID=1484116 RepID=UPI001CBC6F2A|nr:hypothetical protein [Hymenobacter psoromatis]